jgi:hypothetical protein
MPGLQRQKNITEKLGEDNVSMSSDEPYVDHKFIASSTKKVVEGDGDDEEGDRNQDGKGSALGEDEGLGLEDEEDEIDVLTKKVETLEKSMAEVLIKITELQHVSEDEEDKDKNHSQKDMDVSGS